MFIWILLVVAVLDHTTTITKTSASFIDSKIIKLNSVNLIEEHNYTNPIQLYNFTKLNLKYSRVEILSGSGGDQPVEQTNEFYLNQTELTLYTNYTFDRERLISENKCQEDEDTSASSSSFYCLINLKLATYDSENNLLNIFILPVYIEDINDNAPSFKSNSFNLSISENILAVVPLEAPVDLDSAKYSVQNCYLLDSLSDLFEVHFDHNNQRLSFQLNKILDRESQSIYHLTLECADYSDDSESVKHKSRANLVINVQDANDNVPFFKHDPNNLNLPLNISVFENISNSQLIQVEAEDNDDPNSPNSQLVFSLPSELNNEEIINLFSLDEVTGILSVKKSLDFEKRKKYMLKIKVQDKGANPVPVYTDLIINVYDVNDNVPTAQVTYVDKYVIKENRSNSTIWLYEEVLPANQDKIRIAYFTMTDLDTSVVNGYNLSAHLTSVSCMNTSNIELDYEEQEKFSFKLNPVVHDSNSVFYVLELVKQLDRETCMYYDLLIRLKDNGYDEQISYLTIRVILLDINDNKPMFKETVIESDLEYFKFNVHENEGGLNFAKISAYDLDALSNSALDYKILDENNQDLIGLYTKNHSISSTSSSISPNFLFYINPDNGWLSLRGDLDREQCDKYVFTVRICDKPIGKETSLCNDVLVIVEILDQNDNDPAFQSNSILFYFKENMPENSPVGSVKAIDADLDPKTEYLIRPAELNDYFYVEPENGILMSRVRFDAEDVRLQEAILSNKTTFRFELYARDSLKHKSTEDFDLSKWSSKMNISIFLTDINDNPAEIIEPNTQEDKIIKLNLNNVSNTNHTVNLKTIQIKDVDRDSAQNSIHQFKFAFIRRMSWQFIFEIAKNQLKNTTNAAPTINADKNKVLEFLENVIESQKKYDAKVSNKVNLRSIFTLKTSSLNTLSANLTINYNINDPVSYLNWGVYNFSVLVNDTSETGSQRTDLPLKLFVYKTNNTNLDKNQTILLNNIIDSWWNMNSNLVVNYKKQQQSKMNKPTGDDNGDDIDGITQDYYKFYATSLSSSTSDMFFVSQSSRNRSQTGSFIIDYLLLQTSSLASNNSASNIIIVIISFFLILGIILVLIITAKHARASSSAGRLIKIEKKSTKGLLNVNRLSKSSTIEQQSIDQQSTKDLSGSPSLAASKVLKVCLSSHNQQEQQLDHSSSSISLSATSNQEQIISKNYTQTIQQKNLENNTNNNNNTNTATTTNSLYDSFTVITSIVPVESNNNNKCKPSSIEPSDLSSSSITNCLFETSTNNSKFLSTFIASPGSSANDASAMSGNNNNNNNDAGYYGSSDYSEKLINPNKSSSNSKQIYVKQLKSASQHTKSSIATSGCSSSSSCTNNGVQSATNSSSSFTSSSILSSPASTTSSSSSSLPVNSPVVTNLYTMNVYNQLNGVHTYEVAQNANSVATDVKAYLERFERIYNSDNATAVAQYKLASNQKIHQHQQAVSAYSKDQRNSLTTYSYV